MVWPSVRSPYATGRCCANAVVISRPAATRFFTAPPEPPLPWLDRTGGLPCAGASARLVGDGHARPFCEPNVLMKPPPVGAARMQKLDGQAWRPAPLSFLRSNPQGLHLAVQVTALQAQQLGRAGHVPAGLLQLLEDVLALGGFANLLQAAGAVQRAVCLAPRGVERDMARIHAHLRVHDDDPLDQVFQLPHVARPTILRQNAVRLRSQFLRLAAIGGGKFAQKKFGEPRGILAPVA